MKNVYRVSTEQHVDMKSGVSRFKNPTSCKLSVLVLEHVKVQLSPQTRKCVALHVVCGCNCKTSKICPQRTRFFTIGGG